MGPPARSRWDDSEAVNKRPGTEIAVSIQMPASHGVPQSDVLNWRHRILWMTIAAGSFHLAYLVPACAWSIVGYVFALFQLSRQPNRLHAMNTGWLLAILVYAPHLFFFWTIFGPTAIALWLVLGFWLGLFLALLRFVREKWGRVAAAWLAPGLWMGLEFFRSELYYLRFSWLSPGFAFAWTPNLPWIGWVGVYGFGLLLMAGAGWLSCLPPRRALIVGFAVLAALAVLTNLPRWRPDKLEGRELRVAGMQLEFPDAAEVPQRLDVLRARYPDADLYVLSEYTFQEQVPAPVKDWCLKHQKYLLVGGKEPAANDEFFNTAYVIDAKGNVAFQQAKAQPIQFFKDGLRASQQRVWESPWGRIGVCICYDLSYGRVVDELARQGAQAILVPTMDVEEWGPYQHRLHARVGPMRAAEYRVPVFRLASSGISQFVDVTGDVSATKQIPGNGETLAATLRLGSPARRPVDRWLVWPCVLTTCVIAAWGFWLALWDRRRNERV